MIFTTEPQRKLLAIDCSARFLVFGGWGSGPRPSEYLESFCPCYHVDQVSLQALILDEPVL